MTSVHLRHFGDGTVPLLAMHCGQGVGSMWRDLGRSLPQLRITAPDLPGHGRSDPFPDGEDVHDVATATMRPLFDGPMHLIGHSFGATVALRLALETPAQVLSLTLIEPVLFAAAADSPLKREKRAEQKLLHQTAQQGDWMACAKMFNARWGGAAWEDLPEPMQQGFARQMPFVLGTAPTLWEDRAALLAEGRLEQLAAPVHFLRGAKTDPMLQDIHSGLMARLPNARETVVDGAGHMLLLTHGADVARVMSQQLLAAGQTV